MASLSAQVSELIASVQRYNAQADLLLAALGQGAFNPQLIERMITDATGEAVDAVLAELQEYDATNILQQQEMLRQSLDIKNLMGDERYFFEFFKAPFTAADASLRVQVLSTIAGDESVDVSDTSKLTVGETYVISDPDGSIEVVQVDKILTLNRFRATQILAKTRNAAGTLFRTSWDLSTVGKAVVGSGAYYSHAMDILTADDGGRLFIRRDSKGGTLTPYARRIVDGAPQAWVRCPFVESRGAADDARAVDLEYTIPVGGRIELRVDSAADAGSTSGAFDVYWMVAVTPFRAGRADSVRKPTILSPAAGTVGVSEETPAITADAYYSLYGVSQGGMEVEIGLDPLFGSIVYAGSTAGAVATHHVAAGHLATNASYFVRVRYRDAEGDISPWSAAVGFSTGATFQYIVAPAIVSPAHGATNIGLLPTVTTGAFNPEGAEDVHAATQYQIATDGAFTQIVYDSGESADLTRHTLPVDATLARNTPHYLRARFKGAALGWSGWSQVRQFTTVNSGDAPVITAPVHNATGVLLPLAITTSAFAFPGGGEAHVATQYQVATDGAFTQIAYDSGDSAFLTSITVPAGTLAALTEYFIRARHKGATTGHTPWSAPVQITTQVPVGEMLYTAVGNHTFVVPDGVTEVSVVCIGGGGGGLYSDWSYHFGGSGGGLRWGTFNVTPGQQVPITVGGGGLGTAYQNGTGNSNRGGSSSFGAFMTANGGYGGHASGSSPTTNVTPAGGVGGDGGGKGGVPYNASNPGGLGAAGYTGNGGSWKSIDGGPANGNATGGGGGAAGGMNGKYIGGGGGVGVFGAGASGTVGSPGLGGTGGSGGGLGGHSWETVGTTKYLFVGKGGLYGGGGASCGVSVGFVYMGGDGGQGAVRIIWGPGRSYPDHAA